MSKIRQRFLPSIQALDLIPPLARPRSALDAVRRLGALGFYQTVETAVVCDAALAGALGAACAEAGLSWVCWASPFIYDEGLNLSSLERGSFERSVERLTELLKRAAEAGAGAFALLSGQKPADAGKLPEALRRLEEGMLRLAACAKGYPRFRLLIEPLDRDVHKHGTLGSSQEAAALIGSVRREHAESFLVWDSAHFALQEGDLAASLRACGEAVGHIHLCNAVLRRGDPLYGDYHILPGGRGYLCEASAARILSQGALCLKSPAAIPVAVEASAGTDPWQTEETTRHFLERALQEAEALSG